MAITDFIADHADAILQQWTQSVRARNPAMQELGDDALIDGMPRLLLAVARASGDVADQVELPVGVAGGQDGSASPPSAPNLSEVVSAAQDHAHLRLAQGVSLQGLAVEYQALRAQILRSWTPEIAAFNQITHGEQMRFNQALDVALVESATQYIQRLELARDLFLTILGHDLRTPLAVIAHSAALARRAEAPAETRQEAVVRMAKCASRMDRMIQDLLDFTRTRLGTQLPVNPADCDLGQVVREVLDELAALHPSTRVVFQPLDHVTGMWDSERLAQLLSNLVENAIRYSDGIGPVTVEVRRDASSVLLSVHNTGPVISAPEQKAIFDPLRRGINEPHEGVLAPVGAQGLGMGLFIARQIALAHGGSLDVTSSRQEGTRFTAILPAAAETPPPDSPVAH